MKTAILGAPMLAEPRAESIAVDLGKRLSAYAALMKLRLVTLVLVTVAVGFVLGARGSSHPSTLFLTLLGTGLVAGGAGAWNQYLERFRDRQMRRTASRPLPSGKITPREAAVFGTLVTAVGLGILLLAANRLAAGVALATFLLYVFVYTPLKPITTLNTVIGAIPGALPPVIGWAAATGRLGVEAWALFLIVFLWQFPHFLAIAWIHRDDYARAGHRMLPTLDSAGSLTGRQASSYALALVPASLLPATIGLAGPIFFAGALVLGIYYLTQAVRFWSQASDLSARRLMWASFVYLPAILLLLLINPMPA